MPTRLGRAASEKEDKPTAQEEHISTLITSLFQRHDPTYTLIELLFTLADCSSSDITMSLVLDIYELLENILSCLPYYDLKRSRLVNTY